MLVTLKAINSTNKTSKAGKPYISVGMQVEEFPNIWINGFGNKATEKWNKGDKVDIEIYEEDYQGKTYKKFKMVDKTDSLIERVANLEKQMAFLSSKLGAAYTVTTSPGVMGINKAHPDDGFNEAFQKAVSSGQDFPF